MTPEQLEQWRARHGFTQETTADVLGLSPRMVRYYLQGAKPIPRTVGLACFAVDAAVELESLRPEGLPDRIQAAANSITLDALVMLPGKKKD